MGVPTGDSDHPPELTHRIVRGGGRQHGNVEVEVDLEWLGSLAEEFDVVCEGVVDLGGEGGDGEGEGLVELDGREGEEGYRREDFAICYY